MSLPVEEMVASGEMRNDECILCGSCVDGCAHQALNFTFAKRTKATTH